MKHILILIIYLMASIGVDAQIGINTDNPQTLFHVDARFSAATTNSTIGVPTIQQQQDDVVITSDGNMGIGTINPQKRLEINTQNVAGVYPIQIKDVTDPTGKVLMSDANGNGSWKTAQPPAGNIYPIQVIPSTTLSGKSINNFVPNSSFTVPHDGFYSFEIRWWSEYTASYASVDHISVVLKLYNNSTNVDSFRYESVFINGAITCYIPLYSKAKKGDVLSLYINSIEAPGDIQLNQLIAWTECRILIKELQVKF